jgi:hypothetical protein
MLTRDVASDRVRLSRAGLAGFVGGYVMLLAGYWLEAVFGISELDFAQAGVRYASGNRQGWWLVGIIFHIVDSVLLGLLYAVVVDRHQRHLPRSLGPFWGSVGAGIAFAFVVWLVLSMLIAMPFMGSGPFAWKTGSPRPAVASLGQHVIFGSVLGAIHGWRDV